jgi:APA family basic amino acid/polyamine antiporter
VTLKPQLRFFDLTMIIVSMVIGIGIFRNPSIIALHAGTPQVFFLAWFLGALVSICGALTFAEIGARFPVAGGYYKIFSFCYHPALAFMLIWTYILLNAGSTAIVAFTGAQYIAPVILPASLQNPGGEKLLFFLIIGILFFLNYLGIRMGARTQNLLSVLKIALMLLLISALFFIPTSSTQLEAVPAASSSVNFFAALGVSLIAIFFTYGGYQNTANLGGDVKSPQKIIPRSILTAIAIIFILYLLMNIAYVQVLGFPAVQQSPLIAADLGKVLFGTTGAAFASVVIFVSVLGFINTEFLHNPRVLYAMAQEKILPEIFMRVHSGKQVQEFALFFYTMLVTLMFVLLQTYSNLLNYVMFNDTISMACGAYAIFLLRKRKTGDETKGFRIRWFPLIPIIFILMQLTVTGYVIYSDPKNSLIGFLVMLLGYPLYLLLKKLNSAGIQEKVIVKNDV